MRYVRPLLLLLALAACSGAKPPFSYDYVAPPAAAAPAGLEPATWEMHLTADLLPFWKTDVAKGTPVGNFPTWRGMDGSLQAPSTRKPRMLGRQAFTYSIGFMVTGDESLLDMARAGNRWLLDHARDTARGGW